MRGLTLTQQEQVRLHTLNMVLEKQMGVEEAAYVLGLSERHTWRILAAYRKEGVAALAHGNRGRSPANATPEVTKHQVVTLARTRYARLNHTHLTELLMEREGATLARSTVRSILVGAGLASPRHRRPPRHRCRRERMLREGVLVQMDGSRHDWLEGRGPWLTLLLAMDDATGTVPYAMFHEQEDTLGYFMLLWGIIQSRGAPLAVYTDRHAVFQTPRRASETMEVSLPGERGRTQVGRALQELGVSQVFARSPEAKGRVERAAGTFQDRLVSELRLAGASTMAEANRVLWEFLPRFNDRFGVPPAQLGSAYRLIDSAVDLAAILCFKHFCKVARDNTVKYKWHTLQLLPGQDRPSYTGVRAEIQERLDGRLVVRYQDRVIPTREAPPRPGVLRAGYGVWGSGSTTASKWLADGFVCYNVGHRKQDDEKETAVDRLPTACSFQACPVDPKCHAAPGFSSLSDMPLRRPTPLQQARWDAVQAAKRRGLSLRAIARDLGISRNTVRRHIAAHSPPVYPFRRSGHPTRVPP